MIHRLLFLDAETFYDTEYSLTKMAPPNYILDPRFELIGCATKEGDAPSKWIDGPDFPEFLAQYDPKQTTTVAFNALFDSCIFAWRYGFVPARMVCSMRLAVALRGHMLPSYSLAKVGNLLGVGTKGTLIENVKGMRRQDIINAGNGLWERFQDYANNDNEMNAAIFYKLMPEFPTSERRVMDRVLRCAVEPAFQIDTQMLAEHLAELKTEKLQMLRMAAGMPEDRDTGALDLDDDAQIEEAINKFAGRLRSQDKFKELLEAHGVDIEYKQSLSDPEKEIPAFAKTDEFMSDLLEHEDPIVQALAAARLGVRSTIEETRGQRMLLIANLNWPDFYRGGNFPIPLRYSGAHTHRLSGDWKINMQNLPSGRGTKISKLRKSLIASPGHKVVTADLAQIEARVNAWVCGQQDVLDAFANRLDLYGILASDIFGFTVDKNNHPIERFIGKGCFLGCGFGCGPKKLYNMVVREARKLGMDVKKLLETWTLELAEKAVGIYRGRYSKIKYNGWYRLDEILPTAWCGLSGPVKFGPCIIGNGYVEGPNGLKMQYYVTSTDPTDLCYVYGKRSYHIHGAKFLENIVQFLARIIVMNAALRLWDRGYKFKLQSHDELAFIIPDSEINRAKKIIKEEMIRRPSWAPDLPLDAELGSGQSYGDAK